MNVKLTWKRVVLVLTIVGAVLLGVLLMVSGQWNKLKRLSLKVGIKQREIDLEKLNIEQTSRVEELKKDAEKLKELEERRHEIQKKKVEAELKVKGMSHEEVVAELRRRNY